MKVASSMKSNLDTYVKVEFDNKKQKSTTNNNKAEATTKSDTKVHTKTYSRGVYTGELKNNKMHGKGIFKWSDGKVIEGTWKEGDYVK